MDRPRQDLVQPAEQDIRLADEIQQAEYVEVAIALAAIQAAKERCHPAFPGRAHGDRHLAVTEPVAQMQGGTQAYGVVPQADVDAGDVGSTPASEEEIGPFEFGRVQIDAVGHEVADCLQSGQALVQRGNALVGPVIHDGHLEPLARSRRQRTPELRGMDDKAGAHLTHAHDHDVRRAQRRAAVVVEGWPLAQERGGSTLGRVESFQPDRAFALGHTNLPQHAGKLVVDHVDEAGERRPVPPFDEAGGLNLDPDVDTVIAGYGDEMPGPIHSRLAQQGGIGRVPNENDDAVLAALPDRGVLRVGLDRHHVEPVRAQVVGCQ